MLESTAGEETLAEEPVPSSASRRDQHSVGSVSCCRPACPSPVLFPHLSPEPVFGAARALDPLSDSPSTAGAGAHHVLGLSSLPDLPSPSGLIIG